MVLRIVPWPLPTIQGQATNAGGGGGGGSDIQYINLDNLTVEAFISSHWDGSSWEIDPNVDKMTWTITGIEVNDITGLSVIEEFNCIDFKNTGRPVFGPNEKPVSVSANVPTFAYSVGANVNRTVTKNSLEFDALPANYQSGKLYIRSQVPPYEFSGNATFTIKVVKADGTVVQTKTVTIENGGFKK